LHKNIPLSQLSDVVHDIPVSNDGHFLIYWYGRGGTEGVFRYYPFATVVSSALKYQMGAAPPLPPSLFKDKDIIVGGTAPGLWDMRATPFTSLEAYPGMEIHATILSNLLQGDYLHDIPPWSTYSLIIILSLVGAVLFFRIQSLSTAIISFLIILVVFVGFTFFIFYVQKLWLPMITPSVALISTFAFSAFYSYSTEGRQCISPTSKTSQTSPRRCSPKSSSHI